MLLLLLVGCHIVLVTYWSAVITNTDPEPKSNNAVTEVLIGFKKKKKDTFISKDVTFIYYSFPLKLKTWISTSTK